MIGDATLKSNSEKLFQLLGEKHTNLFLGEDISHARNIVRRGRYRDYSCIAKIGLPKDLQNALDFARSAATPTQFKIPSIFESGSIEHEDIEYAYYIEEAVDGTSLSQLGTFSHVSEQILEAIIEIDQFPQFKLTRTDAHKKILSTEEGVLQRMESISAKLSEWSAESQYPSDKLLKECNSLLEDLYIGKKMERSTVHGEFNFNHLLFDDEGVLWIIDWEKVSQHYTRFFDLAEYLGRLVLTQPDGFEIAGNLLNLLKVKKIDYHQETLRFGILNRVIGALWEVTVTRQDVSFGNDEESRVLKLVNDLF